MGINREMRDETLILENSENGARITIRETVKDGSVCFAPQGQLTASIVHDLEDELTSIALVCTSISVDMRDVELIDNSVIRMLLDVQHIVDGRDGELVLQNVGPDVFRQFEEMGLDAVFFFE